MSSAADATAAGPFSRTTLVVVVAVAAVSLVVAIVLTVVGQDPGERSTAGADAYSYSALGHRGLVNLLEKLDVPVVVSRDASADKARRGVLVIAEPKLHDAAARSQLIALVRAAPRVLVVLPKWYGLARRGEKWIERAVRIPESEVRDVLRTLGDESAVSDGRLPPDLAPPWPALDRAQLVDGYLVKELARDTNHVWVLADPDVLNNAGLRHPENARFTIELIDQLRAGGPVVFDEVSHGHGRPPSLLRVLFRFPLVLATLQLAVCALLIIWAAMVRFGPRKAAPPPLAPGKDFLVRNTAALLRFGGHDREALARYLAHSIAAVRHAVHAPDGLSHVALVAWLERVRAARGGTISLAELEEDVAAVPASPHRVVELADVVHRWRMEMMHGAQRRS